MTKTESGFVTNPKLLNILKESFALGKKYTWEDKMVIQSRPLGYAQLIQTLRRQITCWSTS